MPPIVQSDQKESKSEQAVQIIGHIVAKSYANKRSKHGRRQFMVSPSTTRRHGNFAGVHTLLLLWILLSSNNAVLINIITGLYILTLLCFYIMFCVNVTELPHDMT
jgi:hypothetical protein